MYLKLFSGVKMTEETGVNLSESMVLKSVFNWMQTNIGYLILNSINFLSELLFPNRLPWKALCLLYHKMPEVLSCDSSASRGSGSGAYMFLCPSFHTVSSPFQQENMCCLTTPDLFCTDPLTQMCGWQPLGPGACITFSPLCPYSLSPPYRECTAALSLTYWVVAFF